MKSQKQCQPVTPLDEVSSSDLLQPLSEISSDHPSTSSTSFVIGGFKTNPEAILTFTDHTRSEITPMGHLFREACSSVSNVTSPI